MEAGTNQIYGVATTEGEYKGYKRLFVSEALPLEAITEGLEANARVSLAGETRVFIINLIGGVAREHPSTPALADRVSQKPSFAETAGLRVFNLQK
jgi:hypothetical protein